jgi:hypothetical protein
MILGVQGTRKFDKYQSVFLRGMGRALSSIKDGDNELIVYSAGPVNINAMCMEFINITERSLKSRGIRTRVVKVSPGWLKDNIRLLDMFLYFCAEKESYSDVYKLADSKDIEAEVYRY